jgi:hypothetical protein
MYRKHSIISSCPICKKYFWTEKVMEIGSLDDYSEDDEFIPNAKINQKIIKKAFPNGFIQKRDTILHLQEVTDEKEFFAAISAGIAKSKDQEINLRIEAWWAGNHPFRESEADETFPSISERSPTGAENLERLFTLLSEFKDNNSKMLAAEIARELGQFDKALSVLKSCDTRKLSAFSVTVIEHMRYLIEKNDPLVRSLDMIEQIEDDTESSSDKSSLPWAIASCLLVIIGCLSPFILKELGNKWLEYITLFSIFGSIQCGAISLKENYPDINPLSFKMAWFGIIVSFAYIIFILISELIRYLQSL